MQNWRNVQVQMFIDEGGETSKCREGRGSSVYYFIFTSQVFKVQTKVFMRGDAINKHLSVGFWDLVGVRSLWECRCHQRLLSPTFKTYPKSKRDNYERVGAIIILWLSTTCNREPGHLTRPWINPCQAQGRGFSPSLLRAEAPGILKIFWTNTDFHSQFSLVK